MFFLLVLCSRIPFLFYGFGLDPNAWAVALAALHFHESGVYEASRFPGFPVHEMLSSLTVSHGYFLTNMLVAVISTTGILFFVLTLRALRFRYPLLGGAVLAAVPIMYLSSVITYDYSIALTFVLAALYFTVKGWSVPAGIFLGLAVGCRITSGAMLLPLAIIITHNDGMRANANRILRMTISTVVIGVFAFLPVISQYGFSFFTYEKVPYPDIGTLLFKLFFESWGVLGVLALFSGLFVMMLPAMNRGKKFLFPRSVNEKYVVAWLIAIDLYIIAFLKLPTEAGYLLPAVPFIILLFGKYLYSEAFVIFAMLILMSPFLVSLTQVGDPAWPDTDATGSVVEISGQFYNLDVANGPLPEFESRRRQSMARVDTLFRKLNNLDGLSLVIAGQWYNQIQFRKDRELKNQEIIFVDYINEESLDRYFENGYDLYYLPGQDRRNFQKYNFELRDNFDAVEMDFE